MPAVAMRTPPMAGPTARAAFTVTEFSVMALRSSSVHPCRLTGIAVWCLTVAAIERLLRDTAGAAA